MRGDPAPPTRICSVPLYERVGSVSAAPGLFRSPPMAVEMRRFASEMKLQIPGRKWSLWRGGMTRLGSKSDYSDFSGPNPLSKNGHFWPLFVRSQGFKMFQRAKSCPRKHRKARKKNANWAKSREQNVKFGVSFLFLTFIATSIFHDGTLAEKLKNKTLQRPG